MGPVTLGLAGAAAALLIVAELRSGIIGRIGRMINYRERTKADTVTAATDFLHLGTSGYSRPLTFFRINDEVRVPRRLARSQFLWVVTPHPHP